MKIKPINNIKRHQYGLVLFIALIALVVMSLAAVALIRSVDTNTQVTGNLVLKQSATIASYVGIEAMANTIGQKAIASAENNDASIGYYAVCSNFDVGITDVCNGKGLKNEANWVDANSELATGTGFTNGVDAYGNKVRYIVERMCKNTGPVTSQCIIAKPGLDNNTHASKGAQNDGTIIYSAGSALPLYRVTVRIEGPKNTVNYVQAFFS